VGRTGIVTPVANLTPVHLAGTVVKRATLNNADFISGLGLHNGDTVYIEKGGEIIPKITRVDENLREPGATPIKYIENCPVCGAALVRNEGESGYYCPNYATCPPQITGRIIHFVTRKAMDINCGEATIELLYKAKLVNDIADLYSLKVSDIEGLERQGRKSAENLVNSLEKSKQVPFERVLYALGIRYVGEGSAKILARKFHDIDALAAASVEEIASIKDIGEVIAKTVFEWLHNEVNIKLIQRLREAGLQFALEASAAEDLAPKSDKLAGMNIIVTGSFATPQRRSELEKMVEQHGGKLQSGVNAKTNFVVAGAKPGASKVQKAEKLGIKIITEEDFLAILD
jgi:DNA ligase (NAD+)